MQLSLFRLTFFSFLIMVGLQSTGLAQTLHFLVFADTDDPNLGQPTLVTLGRFRALSGYIERNAGMKVELKEYKGKSCSVSVVDEVVSKLTIQPKDAVFFYFIGHGWNNFQSEAPMLFMGQFGETPNEKNSRSLEMIYKQIRQKNARFTLVIGEACNREKAARVKVTKGNAPSMPPPRFNATQFKNLFLNSSQSILLHTCQRNQQSFSDDEGGWFAQSFMNAIYDVTNVDYRGNAQWNELLQLAQTQTSEIATNNGAHQNPVFHIENNVVYPVVTVNKPSKIEIKPNPNKPTLVPVETTPSGYLNTGNPVQAQPKTPCLLNQVAMNVVQENFNWLDNFWQQRLVPGADADELIDAFENFYLDDREEFYENLPEKLDLIGRISEDQINWFRERGRSINKNLRQVQKYEESPADFINKAESKLAVPAQDHSDVIRKLKNIIRECEGR